MKKWLLFFTIAALMLGPWPVAYAYDNNLAGPTDISVEAAGTDAAPGWNAYGNAIGAVTPGDLFYINTENATADLPARLLLTNIDELVHSYRYVTLKIGVYIEGDNGQWEEFLPVSGMPPQDIYLTMLNGGVEITLPGYTRCKISIDRGCFYSYGIPAGGKAAAPSFYLSAG